MSEYLGEKLQRAYPHLRAHVDYVLAYDPESSASTLLWFANEPEPDLEALDQGLSDLELVKERRSAAITARRNVELRDLVAAWGDDQWDADEDTSNRIANALSMVREAAAQGITAPTHIPWRTADNQDRGLSIAELTAMGAAVFLAQQVVWATQAQLKNAIAAASTVEQVNAIDWP
jgi:hypothetical protein